MQTNTAQNFLEKPLPIWVMPAVTFVVAGFCMLALSAGRTIQEAEAQLKANDVLRTATNPRVVSKDGMTYLSNDMGESTELPTDDFNRLRSKIQSENDDAYALARKKGIKDFRLPPVPSP